MIKFVIFAFLFLPSVGLTQSTLQISSLEAEQKALENSPELKAYQSIRVAALENADAAFASLYPQLSLGGSYQYNTHVPTITLPFPGAPSIPFGAHDQYGFGPTLGYTLWDTGQTRNAYKSSDLLAHARLADEKNAELQLLLSVRTAYLKLQLALEELRLLNNSLQLSHAQNHDIETNFRAGAATRLDRVDSQRDVINYQLQFEQKQAEVQTDLKDLLALIQIPEPQGSERPGPPGVPGVDLTLKLDSLDQSLTRGSRWKYAPPDDSQPSVLSQRLQAAASDRAAESQKASLYPIVQTSASAKIEYPDEVNLTQVEQNTFMISVSMPLFEGGHAHHLVEEARHQAEAARFNEQQTKINLLRDYEKSIQLLESLKTQQRLSNLDVERSEDAAKLYYQSYRGGKINLIDVQSANNRALTSKVNAARINAQMLTQMFNLQAISGAKNE